MYYSRLVVVADDDASLFLFVYNIHECEQSGQKSVNIYSNIKNVKIYPH